MLSNLYLYFRNFHRLNMISEFMSRYNFVPFNVADENDNWRTELKRIVLFILRIELTYCEVSMDSRQ